MRSKHLAVALTLVVVLAITAIIIGKRAPAPPLNANHADVFKKLPNSCFNAVVIPNFSQLNKRIGELSKLKLADLAAGLISGQENAGRVISGLTQYIGFDPRSDESLYKVGIDPSRPWVYFIANNPWRDGYSGAENSALLVIPTSDYHSLESLLLKHAKNLQNATERQTLTIDGNRITALSKPDSKKPTFLITQIDTNLILAIGPENQAILHSIFESKNKPETSLASSDRVKQIRARLGSSEIYGFSCPHGQDQESGPIPPGTAWSISFPEHRVALTIDVPLKAEQKQELSSLAIEKTTGLLNHLDANAFAYVYLGIDLSNLNLASSLMNIVPPVFDSALRQGNINLSRDVFSNLKPGMAFSFKLAPTASLARISSMDPRSANPFQSINFEALGRTRDVAKAKETLKKIAAIAPKFGAQIKERQLENVSVYQSSYPLGEGASFSLKDDWVVLTGGYNQMETALNQLSNSKATSSLAIEPALHDSAFALVIDLSKLATQLRSLPESAYGGLAMRAMAMRWVDAMEELFTFRINGGLVADTFTGQMVIQLSNQKGSSAP